MARKTSDLSKLVRGEGGLLWPSRHERRLLKFALDTFGEMLGQFLLTGLGKKKVAQRWAFAITFAGDEGTLQKRRLRVITHEPPTGESLLPRGRDPLVLLALLRLLLRGRREATPALLYQQQDVLNLLGWEDTEGARSEVDEAIGRYSLLMYVWELERVELARHGLSHCRARERMISEYLTTDREAGEAGQMKRVANRVTFDEYFIEGLARRSLFDVPWDRVRAVKLVPPPAKRK